MNPRERLPKPYFPQGGNPLPPKERGSPFDNFLQNRPPKNPPPDTKESPPSFPSLDAPINSSPLSKEEYPTPEDINRAKTIKGELKQQSGEVSAPVALGMAGGTLVAGGVGGWFLKDVFAAESIGSVPGGTSFSNNDSLPTLEGLPPNLEQPKSTNKVSPEKVSEVTVTRGVINEENTVKMTPEEYAKISPPLVERENRKDTPVEVTAPTAPTGTRQLIIEQGTGINALIFIKTPEGGIRQTHYVKKENPSQLIKHIGTDSKNVSFSSCSEYLGNKNEIREGDIFPAPITGEVYYYGNKINYHKGRETEEGTVNAWYYDITGEYVDEEGKKFEAAASIYISSYSDLTKPLVEGMPNMKDYELSREDKEKMPKVTVTQGHALFRFVTRPSTKSFSSDSKEPEAQIKTTRGYFEKGGNRSGGEKCLNPSIDGKRIVPLQ